MQLRIRSCSIAHQIHVVSTNAISTESRPFLLPLRIPPPPLLGLETVERMLCLSECSASGATGIRQEAGLYPDDDVVEAHGYGFKWQ